MYQQHDVSKPGGGRVQWGSYGFLAGIAVGLMLGWFFHGIVGAVVRVGMAAVVIVPLILIFIAWRKVVAPWIRPDASAQYTGSIGAIETRGVVRESHPR